MRVIVIVMILTVFDGCIANHKDYGESKWSLDCSYCPVKTQDNSYPELTTFRNCAYEDENGNIVIRYIHLKNMFFDDDNLAPVYLKDKDIVYVNRRGKTARVFYFDNGADYFQEGLSRTIKNGKIGFINKALDIVIAPKFDFAFPFSGGVAVVCNDCRLIHDGEYMVVVGGKWGYIDKNGNNVIPIFYEKDELPQLPTTVVK